jgi:putative two-component system response regulator
MKRHTTVGRDAIVAAERDLDPDLHLPFLANVKDIAYCHHEKWDGSGYPQGLSGEQIPVSARIMAMCDVYDALTSRRIYKPALSHQKAMIIMVQERGTHFDPYMVDTFLELAEEFKAIGELYHDSEVDVEKAAFR